MNNILFTFEELQTATSGTWHNLNASADAKKGIECVSTDTRKDNSYALFLALSGENFDAHYFLSEAIKSNCSALCLQQGKFDSKKLPSNVPILEVPNTLKAYQDLASFHRKRLKKLTLIAITGSNGKTSTKDILHGLLSHQFGKDKVYTTKANTNNQIGVPQNLLNVTNQHEFAVIELGSNHPGEIQELVNIANPDIAVITSIGPAHLEFFKNLDGVVKEKSSIFTAFLKPNTAIATLPASYKNHKTVAPIIQNLKTITFGEEDDADISFKLLKTTLTETKFNLHWKSETHTTSWKVPGKHQITNAAAAAAVATAINMSPKDISAALSKCKLITGMRMSIKEDNGITWVNDAYNSNPSSAKAGIDWIHEIAKDSYPNKFKRILVVLGDMKELGDNTNALNKEIIDYAADTLPFAQIYTVGPVMCTINNFSNSQSHFAKAPRDRSAIRPVRRSLGVGGNPKSPAFSDSGEAASFFKEELRPNDLIYLKGSRGIALEKIEKQIVE